MTKKSAFALILGLTACATPPRAQPPAWFSKPPESPADWYFVGDATGQPDEETARDIALQKALHQLLVYCGARIDSEFKSLEIEKSGAYEQSVEMSVNVKGEAIEVQKTKLKTWEVSRGPDGFDGYALIAWPKEEYARVMGSRQKQAEQALEHYLRAEGLMEAGALAEASESLVTARNFLGDSVAVVSISHPKFVDTRVLRVAIDSLEKRLSEADKGRKSVVAVDVICRLDGKVGPCKSPRSSALKQIVSERGKKVSAATIAPDVVERVLDAKLDGSTSLPVDAGWVMVVEYSSDFREKDAYGFVYVNYSARAAILDSNTRKVVFTKALPATKVGHVKLEGAIEKGMSEAEKSLGIELKSAVGELR